MKVPSVVLSNGKSIPVFGLGTWQLHVPNTSQLVHDAIANGYRHIDCAEIYENEDAVGKGIKMALDEGIVKREDLFITSKLWNSNHRPEYIGEALKRTLANLQISYVDLYLIHWPVSWVKGKHDIDHDISLVDVYKEMEKYVDSGLISSLGISNFSAQQAKEIYDAAKHKPVMNQVESHPLWNQFELQKEMDKLNITITAYSPLGLKSPEGVTPLLSRTEVINIAKKHNKHPVHVALRWQIQHGRVTICKASSIERLVENIQINDFVLDEEDLKILDNLQPQLRFVNPVGFSGPGEKFFKD